MAYRGLNYLLHSWYAFVFSCCFLGLIIVINLWPASWWFEANKVFVKSPSMGHNITLLVDRTIHREFVGTWVVIVRQWDGAGWVNFCTGNGSSVYKPTSKLPNPLTLEWWTDGACKALPRGKYIITTVWTIPGGYLADKTIHIDSNVFEVQ